MLIAGRYRLIEPVGSGGMGRVWLSRDEMLDRDVAVKEFVPPDWMTDEEQTRLRDRTLREARSAGRLNHPHVVRVYDVVHAEDLPWIVMEYVPSRSLHQVINDDGPYSPAAAARIGLAVLDALTAAHRAGVLHRDVKPHNVLIGTDGRVVLTDFGLATFVDDGAVTGPGLVVGSPQYVSPERARDGASTVESDMWSLGATLYTAVEGRSPYARDTAMATLMALATEPPDPPERAGALAPVLLGLLRHEPDKRLTGSEVDRRLRLVAASGSGVPSPRRGTVVASVPVPPAGPAVVPGDKSAMSGGGDGAPSTAEPTPDGADRDRRSGAASLAGSSRKPASRAGSGSHSHPGDKSDISRDDPAKARSRSILPTRRRPSRQGAARPPSRPTLIAAAVAVAAALLGGGGIVASYIMQRGGDPPATAAPSTAPPRTPQLVSFSPAGCAGPAPSAATRLPQRNATRGVQGWTLPRGWAYFADGTGVHIAVPDGWSVQKAGTMYCFRDRAGDRVLSLDTGRNPAGDPVAACRAEAARLVREGALRGYQELSIEARPLLNKAADWEYRYQEADGTELHARTRWLASNGRGFAISWSSREIDWTGDLAKINMVLSTFYVDRA
ncbi:serine/threonine protein kinase [Paractinoplanes rishiriensis]|uniref:non-specific serine/threonine protein kinase n=2 Tax=Paractinoplanes rishiriensis TaxID=1050105 RepID=A0A919MST8_9ACTN|nr:serine/threonine protein kinase [Actinoplanes rishiriensis]